ncbi:NAD(P)/FAD-dependent oxidoreductase [Cyanobium sp. ATX 6F1]|uniref:NAD(P)/FAD-dependent oxidoreductase n=1 Tax=Cyanobium sp. ATX 6F1 TaxID=2823702 RepID=UPI0020CC4145|nr:FAD-dependent oxidoreductase [Cyanobium sp. ATX 6F1]
MAANDALVVIAGGGFGGLYTSLALADRRPHPPILLIEPNERFLFLPLLYELLSGELRSWEIAPRYDSLLAGRGVAWLRDRVVRVDAERHCLQTAQGRELAYGRLVLATGARPESFGVPGVSEHALGFRSLADVERLQALVERLRLERRPLQRLAVIGGGPTGVELACKLADLLGDAAVIELIEQGGELLASGRSFNREQALAALQRKDVRLRTRTRVLAIETGAVQLSHQAGDHEGAVLETLRVDGVIWAAGSSASLPELQPIPPLGLGGRLTCGTDLSVVGLTDVFALGDGALVHDDDERPLPATAQVAFQQAELLARNLLHSFAGEPLEPFHWNDLGEMVSLGVGNASLTGLGFTLAGPTAFRLRQIAYLARLPGLPHQLKVAAGWLSDLSR